MHSNMRHGLDYTPLFKFLIGKVGEPWDAVFGEAVSRIDAQEPVFWLVAQCDADQQAYVRTGESSYFSGLFVDESGILRKVDPELNETNLRPFCACCTHTFNGNRLILPFVPG